MTPGAGTSCRYVVASARDARAFVAVRPFRDHLETAQSCTDGVLSDYQAGYTGIYGNYSPPKGEYLHDHDSGQLTIVNSGQ